jgi:eukaryotic-like serine/threonine-protein kinase
MLPLNPRREQDADKNLLFGVLALQMDFVSREELIAATSAWLLAKERGLDRILLERQALSEEEHALLAALVAKHLARHDQDPRKSLAALSSLGSVRDELQRLEDQDLRASLVHVPSDRAGDARPADPFATQAHAESRPQGMRFRILRPHAEGGLGKVSVAHDCELNREVAFKEIKPQYADDLGGRARFVLEAEITGGLEHPGIVPVYGLGQYADGRPFYAMRFVRGDSLNDALVRFHEEGGAAEGTFVSGERGVEFRKLLRRFMDVCNALEYAHCRGVLHRDLKPGNVMLGKHGETLVVDWGLARAQGKAEHLTDQGEATLRPASGSAVEPTQLGRAIGTPAFMSPEQAAGRLDQLGPATDVYSLGATLYMILTGQPPITEGDIGAVLRKVQAGDIPPARSMNRQIPAALDSICRRAMALRTEDRYPTAMALAEEIEHWLADEPVQAHRENLIARAARWTRKNRSWAISVAAALVAILSATVTATLFGQKLQISQLANEEIAARKDAEKARDREEQARDAAVSMAREKSRIAAEKSELADQNLKLAEEKRFEAFEYRHLSDLLAGAFQAADPLASLGEVDVYMSRRNPDQLTARQILDNATSRLKSTKELDPFPLAKATMMDAIGNLYSQLGLWLQAEPLLADALRIRREELPKDHADLAVSCHNLGWFYHKRGDFVRAEPYYREALAIREKIPGSEGLLLTAETLQNLAWMAANDRQHAVAEKLFKQSLEIRRKLHGDLHHEVDYCKLGIALVLIEQRKYLEALPIIMAVESELGQVEEYSRLTAGITALAQGLIDRNTLGLQESEVQLRKALEEVNAALGPENVFAALIEYELGSTLEELGKSQEAELYFRDALKVAREKFQMQHPRIALLVARYASFLATQNRAPEGKALWEEFLRAQRGRFGDDHRLTADAIRRYASFLRETENRAAARESAQEALRILDRQPHGTEYWDAVHELGLCCLPDQPAEAESLFRKVLASDHVREMTASDLLIVQTDLASVLVDQGNWDAAEEILARVREQGDQLEGRIRARRVDEALQNLTRVYLGKRDAAKAAEMIQARAKYVGNDAEKLYVMANHSARCALLVGEPRGVLSEADRERRARYLESALKLLKEAVAAGLKDLERIKKNHTLSILGEFPEFQKIISEIDKTAP